MISDICSTKAYIQQQHERLGCGDLIIIDKCIHALALLGNLTDCLVYKENNFIFIWTSFIILLYFAKY